MKARLYDKYKNEVLPALREKHKYTNVHQIPRFEKIVVNMGVSASLEKSGVTPVRSWLTATAAPSIACEAPAQAVPSARRVTALRRWLLGPSGPAAARR